MKPATIIVGILMVPLLAGCAAKPAKPAAKTCQSEIRLDQEPQPLGSSKALTTELETAGRGHQPISLGEVTHAAGWSDDWDTMIKAAEGYNDDWMNKTAQTPAGTCWTGLPPRIDSEYPAPFGYYVFLKDQRVVQSVVWRTGAMPLLLRPSERLTHETMLNAKGGGLATY
ncbi:hypothetical protein [Nocardia tengchongensis]|uniref:hypothetical protein n=1 Tax=Nocardia tengchongensis TaxID=2055889 RepID=UPI00365670B0